jgi:PAS domain S-box-containing protein
MTDAKTKEKARWVSEEKIRALIEASAATIWTTNAEGAVVEDSPSWRAFTGQNLEEWLGRGWLNAIHPEDRIPVERRWTAAVASGASFDSELRLYHAESGAWRLTRVCAVPVRNAEGRIESWVGMNVDIGHRRRAELAVAESEERFHNMADHAPVMMWVTDPNGYCSYLNRAWYEFTGQTAEEAAGFGWLSATHPDDMTEAQRAFVAANASRQPFRIEYRLRRADGTYRWAIDTAAPRFGTDGQFLGYIGSVIDIDIRREMENKLRESEARFRLATDAVPHIVWIVDVEGRNEFFNRQWFDYTGAPHEPATVEGVAAGYIHPDDAAETLAAFDQSRRTGTTFAVEHRIRSKSGEYRWFLVQGEPYRDPASGTIERWYGASVDIHDRKLAEAKLRASEERLRLATENAEVGFWDVDEINHVLHWPPRVKAMFGISADVPISMADFFAGLHPDDREATIAAYAAAADSNRRSLYDVEYRTIGKEDGIVRWVAAKGRGLFDERGRCVRVTGTAIDITKRKAIEQQLRLLNETLESLVREQTAERNRVWSMSRDLLAIMGFDGYLKAINPAWETTLGFDERTLLSRDFSQQVHPDDHAAIGGVMQRLQRGEVIERFEDRLRAKDGSWRWISWSLVPEGDVFYAVGRDVTAEKASATELEQAQEALRQSQKMEAMGQLTGGVAHDFNNLLTPIVGSLDMLLRKKLGSEREQRLIAGAMQSAERAKTLVQRLLAFARRQPLQPTAVDISKLVKEMAELVASTTGPQIRIVVDAPNDLPPAVADSNQVEMALLNLAVNARDAMPNGGTLRFSTSSEDIGPSHVTNLKPGRYIRLSVADTGTGMDQATLARAVEPFFSTKGVGKGTGLGLSMVHGLASQLGGALTIASRLRLGTNVELWLPQSVDELQTNEQPIPNEARVAARGTTLLVDDEDLVRLSTADMLADLGYSVVEATSAEEAMVRINRGEHFDLLVTDHLMPGMNGTDLARAVQSDRPGVPVLLISGYAETDGIAADLPRLTKPFRRDELASALTQLTSPID